MIVYEDVRPPEALGYASLAVRIRANPTRAQWEDWTIGASPKDGESDTEKAQREARLMRALVALYSETRAPGLDFRAVDTARATFDSTDLPDELWLWLLWLPYQVVGARREAILKNAWPSSVATS